MRKALFADFWSKHSVWHQMIDIEHATKSHTLATILRRDLASLCICILMAVGMHSAWNSRASWNEVVWALLATFLPATAYALGYFRSLPDALGAPAVDIQGNRWQRWSDFARLSALISMLVTLFIWVPVGENDLAVRVQLSIASVIILAVMAGFVIATEKYLSRTMPTGSTGNGSGWRSFSRRLTGRLGSAALTRFGPKRSLGVGSLMVLISLVLFTTNMSSCSSDLHRGYEIVTGNAEWITIYQTVPDEQKATLVEIDHFMYIIALALAVLALGAVIGKPASHDRSTIQKLTIAAAITALFFLCDWLFAWIRLSLDVPLQLNCLLWAIVWLAPVALWTIRSHGDPIQFQYTQLGIFVFYLPIVFASLAMLPWLAGETPGAFTLHIGLLFLWWGFLQMQWELEDTKEALTAKS